MSRSYGIKKDFGLHGEGGVFLPVAHEAAASQPASSYVHEHKTGPGRGQHGKLNISSGRGRTSETRQGKDGADFDDNAASTVGEKSAPSGSGERSGKKWFSKKKKKERDPIDEIAEAGESVVRSSPMLHVRSAMRSGERDQFGRPQTDPEEPGDEEKRMQLSYDAPVAKAVIELVRLTLRPAKDSSRTADTLQVTLRKRGQGFGLHFSTGLPPITVTYVEPGGDAEAAGVGVGDRVMEVNGEDCETLQDPSKIIALKLLIQQTDIDEVSENIRNETETRTGLNDTAWSKIQDRQHQNETESESSSHAELTQIDGDSDTENVLEEFRENAKRHSQPKQVNISANDWERMREQRELLFDKNAPSAIIQEKGRKKNEITQQSPPQNAQKPTTEKLQQIRGEVATGSVPSPEKQAPKSSGGGWFKRKKKETSGEVSPSSKGGTEQVPPKKQGKSPTKKGHTHSKGTPSTTDGKHTKGGKAIKTTSIDDVDVADKKGRAGKKGRNKKDVGEVPEHIKKTFSYEGPILSPNRETSSLPRSRSHNAMFRATLIQAVQQQQQQSPPPETAPEAPTVSHQRSMSYEDEEERGRLPLTALSQEEGWDNGRLKVESRTTSRSQSDISRLKIDVGGAIDSNVRLKKSGVVKGATNWGQRPTLEVFGAAEEKKKTNVDRVTESTDGPALSSVATSENDPKSVDLGVVPPTNPSLGQSRTRRDLVARSSVKRRPPKNREALLFKVDDDQKMGKKRVELSELSSTHRSRTHTMPEKTSKKVVESTPVTSSLKLSSEYREQDDKQQAKNRGATRNILKDLQQHSTSNGLGRTGASNGLGRTGASNGLGRTGASNGLERIGASNGLDRTGASNSLEQTSVCKSLERTSASNGLGRTGASNGLERTGASNSLDCSRATNSVERTRASNSLERTRASNSLERTRASNSLERTRATNSLDRTRGERERVEAFHVRQSSDTTTGSSVEMVARALANKKRLSTTEEEARKTAEEAEKEGEGEEKKNSLCRGTAGSAILARLRQEESGQMVKEEVEEKEGVKEKMEVGKKNEEVTMEAVDKQKERTDEKQKSKMEKKAEDKQTADKQTAEDKQKQTSEEEEEKKTVDPEKSQSHIILQSRRRNKTVEKPVKSLGIASDPDLSPADHTPQKSLVTLRKAPATEPRPVSSSSSAPSWIAMAEKKKQRVSAMFVKAGATKSQSPPQDPPSPPPTSPPITTHPPTTKHSTSDTSTPSATQHITTISPSITKSTSPPVTKSTSPSVTSPPVTKSTSPPVTKSTSPPVTKPTSPPVTKSTSPSVTSPPVTSPSVTKFTSSVTKFTSPVTKSTSPPVTKSTSPPVTKSTSPPVTKPTSPPVTKSTSPPVTKPTSPPVTKSTSPPVTKPTSPPVTKFTSPVTKFTSPVTKSTSPSVTKSTSPPVTKPTTPIVTKPPSTPTKKESEQSIIPRKGTVRDRIALFQ